MEVDNWGYRTLEIVGSNRSCGFPYLMASSSYQYAKFYGHVNVFSIMVGKIDFWTFNTIDEARTTFDFRKRFRAVIP